MLTRSSATNETRNESVNTNAPDNLNILHSYKYYQPMHIIPPTGWQPQVSGQYKYNGCKTSMHAAKVDL